MKWLISARKMHIYT